MKSTLPIYDRATDGQLVDELRRLIRCCCDRHRHGPALSEAEYAEAHG